jgi:hypothetical protein
MQFDQLRRDFITLVGGHGTPVLSFCGSSVFGPPGGVPAPETNPHDRTLRYMMPDFTIALAIGLVIGFILGYGLRAIISYRRHRRARRRSYLF